MGRKLHIFYFVLGKIIKISEKELIYENIEIIHIGILKFKQNIYRKTGTL